MMLKEYEINRSFQAQVFVEILTQYVTSLRNDGRASDSYGMEYECLALLFVSIAIAMYLKYGPGV